MNQQVQIFDRTTMRRHRDRAAAIDAARHGALFDAVAEMLEERIDDVKRDFPSVLDLGARQGGFAARLAQREDRFVVAADISEKMLRAGNHPASVAVDEEFLPFADESFDLIVSNLALHWVNDLPGALAQIRNALRPDGLFLAAFLGGHTLHELRSCLLDAELMLSGGAGPRLSPSIDKPTASALVQRAGFQLPVTDHETVTLAYTDIVALMHDVRGMGETNAHAGRSRKIPPRALFEAAGALYKERFSLPGGRIAATFEIIFIHGWR